MELQADCLAGVWGHSVYVNGQNGTGNVVLEDGDVEEGLGRGRGRRRPARRPQPRRAGRTARPSSA